MGLNRLDRIGHRIGRVGRCASCRPDDFPRSPIFFPLSSLNPFRRSHAANAFMVTSLGMSTSRSCRDRAEELRLVHDSRLRKASSGERLRNALLWLAGVDSEAERDVATMFEHAPYLPQSGARIRPRLHRIDRERLIERTVAFRLNRSAGPPC